MQNSEWVNLTEGKTILVHRHRRGKCNIMAAPYHTKLSRRSALGFLLIPNGARTVLLLPEIYSLLLLQEVSFVYIRQHDVWHYQKLTWYPWWSLKYNEEHNLNGGAFLLSFVFNQVAREWFQILQEEEVWPWSAMLSTELVGVLRFGTAAAGNHRMLS